MRDLPCRYADTDQLDEQRFAGSASVGANHLTRTTLGLRPIGKTGAGIDRDTAEKRVLGRGALLSWVRN